MRQRHYRRLRNFSRDAKDDIKLDSTDPCSLVKYIRNSLSDSPEELKQRKENVARFLADNPAFIFQECVVRGSTYEGPLAAESVHLDLLKMLIELGADTHAVKIWDGGVKNNMVHQAAVACMHRKTPGAIFELCRLLIEEYAAFSLFQDTEEWTSPMPQLIRSLCGETNVEGAVETLKMIFNAIPDLSVNTVDESGWSLLLIAANQGNLDVIKTLVKSGASLHTRNPWGHGVLHLAAIRGDIEMVKYFVSLGCDVNLRGDKGETPLVVAHRQVAEYLILEAGADILLADQDGKTIIHVTAEDWEYEDFVLLWLFKADQTNFNNKTPKLYDILWDAYKNRTEVGSRRLTEFQPNDPSALVRCIQHSCHYSDEELADRKWRLLLLLVLDRSLICRQCVLDGEQFEGPLAAKWVHPIFLNLLLKLGADVRAVHRDKHGNSFTVVHHAAESMTAEDFEHFCNLLLEEFPCPDVFQATDKWISPLHSILTHQEDLPNKTVEMIMEAAGGNINVVNEHGENLLMAAVRGNKDIDKINALVFSGADINATNHKGEGIIHLAALSGQEEALKYFCMLGCNVNLRDGHLQTPLLAACMNPSIAKLLITEYDADTRVADDLGNTILNKAACYWSEHDFHDLVKLLLEMEVLIELTARKNDDGGMPLYQRLKSDKKTFTETLVLLINNVPGVDFNQEDENGENLVALTIKYGEQAVVRQPRLTYNCEVMHQVKICNIYADMVKMGADPRRVRCKNGGNAVHLAVEVLNAEALEYLLDNFELDPDQCDVNGITPLLMAKTMMNTFAQEDATEKLEVCNKIVKILRTKGLGKSTGMLTKKFQAGF